MAGNLGGAARLPAQNPKQRRHPGADHGQADSGDAEEFAHHQFARGDGRKQHLDNPVGFFFNGVVEQHLDDDENGQPQQINKAAGQPLPDGIRGANGFLAGGFLRIEACEQDEGPFDLVNCRGIQSTGQVLALPDFRVNRLLDLIAQLRIRNVDRPVLDLLVRGR